MNIWPVLVLPIPLTLVQGFHLKGLPTYNGLNQLKLQIPCVKSDDLLSKKKI